MEVVNFKRKFSGFLSFIMVLLYSNICYSIQSDQIVYKIEPNNKAHCLDISASLKGNESGTHLLYVPEGGISNLQMRTGSEQLPYFITDNSHIISLKDVPNKNITISYTYCSHNLQRNVHLPIIEKNLIKFVSNEIFLLPVNNPNETKLFGIELSSFPSHFKAISSYNVNQRKFLTYATLAEFSQSLIVIGELNIDKLNVNANNVYAVSNGHWPYLERPTSDYLKSIIKTQRNFWNDDYFPHYIVFLVKQHENHTLPRIVLGKHWNNFAVLLLPEESTVVPIILSSLSHETFHAWLGMKMKFELPQGGLQWFSEGFNDFYGFHLAHESKVISVSDYIKMYNSYIVEYSQSPIKDATNNLIKQHYKTANEFDHIAQLRGHFLAKQLRDKMNDRQGNKFDAAIKALFERYQRESWPYLSEDKIDAVFKEHVGEAHWQEFKEYINSGKEIEFSPKAFYPYAKLKEVKLKVPDFGFNMRTLFYENSIAELNPNSNAYRAGLRNGHKVLNQDIDCKAHDKIVNIAIDDNGSEKIISFKPEVVKKVIPQYVMLTP